MSARRVPPRRGRSAVLLCLALCVASSELAPAAAQAPPPDVASNFQLDFTVPTAPAFTMLDVDPSGILRPATVEQLGLALGEFVGNGSELSIPKAFSAEFAPWLLLDGRTLSRQAYQDKAWLYRLRVSVATLRSDADGSTTKLALGVRTALVDNADLRTNEDAAAYARFVSALLLDAIQVEDRLMAQIRMILDSGPTPQISTLARALIAATTDAERTTALDSARITDEDQRARILALTTATPTDLEGRIAAERARLQELHWNATVVEVAAATLAQARDASGAGIEVERVSGWLTAGIPVLGRSGQLLLGAEAGFQRDTLTTQWEPRGTLGTRLYVGSNYLKFFAEVQTDARTGRSPEVLFNAGGEVRPGIGGWVTFSAGLERDAELHDYTFVSDLKWSFGLAGIPGLGGP